MFHFIYGMLSFPLTNSIMFQDGHIAPPDDIGWVILCFWDTTCFFDVREIFYLVVKCSKVGCGLGQGPKHAEAVEHLWSCRRGFSFCMKYDGGVSRFQTMFQLASSRVAWGYWMVLRHGDLQQMSVCVCVMSYASRLRQSMTWPRPHRHSSPQSKGDFDGFGGNAWDHMKVPSFRPSTHGYPKTMGFNILKLSKFRWFGGTLSNLGFLGKPHIHDNATLAMLGLPPQVLLWCWSIAKGVHWAEPLLPRITPWPELGLARWSWSWYHDWLLVVSVFLWTFMSDLQISDSAEVQSSIDSTLVNVGLFNCFTNG